MRDVRRLVVTLVIGSFSVAAALGILALLTGGDGFGETQGRVLLTTVVVGVESVAVLCYLAVAGRPAAFVGALGGVVSLVPTGLALWLTWGGSDTAALFEVFGVSVTIAASLAQACLLIALAGRHRFGAGLTGTLVAITVVAAMICLAIVAGEDLGDWYWRLFGVVAILDVLGTVVLAATGASGRRARPVAGEPDLLSPAARARLVEAAHRRGTSPTQVLDDALDALLGP